jgi:hypothetical protein
MCWATAGFPWSGCDRAETMSIDDMPFGGYSPVLATCLPFSTTVVGRFARLAPSVWLYAANMAALSAIGHRLVVLSPDLESGEQAWLLRWPVGSAGAEARAARQRRGGRRSLGAGAARTISRATAARERRAPAARHPAGLRHDHAARPLGRTRQDHRAGNAARLARKRRRGRLVGDRFEGTCPSSKGHFLGSYSRVKATGRGRPARRQSAASLLRRCPAPRFRADRRR